MNSGRFSFPLFWRLRLVAVMAVREALHLRILPLFMLVALLPMAAVGWLSEFNFGTAEGKFIIDFGHGALSAGGLVLTVLATVQLTMGELERRSAQMLLTRALTPTELLLGKFFGLVALLTWFATGLALVLGATLWLRLGKPNIPWEALEAVGFIWLKLVVVTALTLLLCSYARSALFVLGATFLLVVLAHLRHLAGAGSGWTGVLVLTLSDLQLFDPERLMVAPAEARPLMAVGTALYAAAYASLYLAVGGWLFGRREY